jgi:hypothetical protein
MYIFDWQDISLLYYKSGYYKKKPLGSVGARRIYRIKRLRIIRIVRILSPQSCYSNNLEALESALALLVSV